MVQWVREWGDRGFRDLATPALVHVSNLRDLRTRVVSPAWQDLTRRGGDGLWHALWGERMIDSALMHTLNYYTPHACLAGVDALWEALPAAWRAVAADPALPLPSPSLQQDAVARIVDGLAWGAAHPPLGGKARPVVGQRPCIPLLGGSTVKAITTLLTWGVQLRRHAAWQQYAEAAMAPQPPLPAAAPRQQAQPATGVGLQQAAGVGQQRAVGVGQQRGAGVGQQQAAGLGQQQAAGLDPQLPLPPGQQHALRDQRRRLEAQGRLAMLDPPVAPPAAAPPAEPPAGAPAGLLLPAQPVLLAADAVVLLVGGRLRAWWRLPWYNVHKDTLWRLTVQGVPWAGGHGLMPNRACGRGWVPAPELPVGERAAAWQEHCFWSCPVASAVVAEVQRGLPALGRGLHRSHVWLLQPPADHVLPAVWDVVCLAALSAMRFGMRVLYAKERTAEEAEEARQQERAANGGLRQAALEELWFGAAQAEILAPAGAGLAEMASRRAAAEFWAHLQEFVSLHGGRDTWEAAKSVPEAHAFIAGRPGGVGGLRVRLPH